MKTYLPKFYFCFALLLTFTSFCNANWNSWDMGFDSGTLKVIYPADLSNETARISWLIEMADRSTKTINPLSNDPDGFIEPGDVVVCSKNLLIWFDTTSDELRTLNGGGGMIRGIWQIGRDSGDNLNFTRIVNQYNLSPNLLRPGYNSNGASGSGISLLGNYPKWTEEPAPPHFENSDDGFTFGIEHESYPTITGVTGSTISDGGKYSGSGVFVQFQGHLANSNDTSFATNLGLNSHYDMDRHPTNEGRVSYTLTHRIPEDSDEFRMEISLNVTQNNFGDIGTMVISHNMAAYDGADLKYSVDPVLYGTYIQTDPIQYYSDPEFNVIFYNAPWNIAPDIFALANTNTGNGVLLGVGLPQSVYPVPFFEFIPISMHPWFTDKYRLQAIDQRIENVGRSSAIDLQYFDMNNGHPVRTFLQGETFNLATDYYLEL